MAQQKLNDDATLEDIRYYLYRRGCYLEQLVKLYCEKNERGGHWSASCKAKIPLFDCLMVVELQIDSSADNRACIKMKYPSTYEDVPHGIEMFCFPDAAYWTPGGSPEESEGIGRTHFLVLTDLQGHRRFGYCRRIMPEGGDVTLPLAYCIISSKRSRIYPKILDELESLHGSDDETTQEMFRLLHAQSFPATVNEPIFVCHSGKIIKQIKRPLDCKAEYNHFRLLSTIGVENLLKAVHTVLLERKLIILGLSMAEISSAVESLCALLSPFSWQHTLIPLLPYSLFSVVDAPTPYIIGLHDSDHLDDETLAQLDDVMMIHLSYEDALISEGLEIKDERFLSTNLVQALKERLEAILDFADDEGQATEEVLNSMISEAFTKFFLGLIGDCAKFIKFKNQGTIFRTENYLNEILEDHKDFMHEFVDTAMFHDYIDHKCRLSLESCAKRRSKLCCESDNDDNSDEDVEKEKPDPTTAAQDNKSVKRKKVKSRSNVLRRRENLKTEEEKRTFSPVSSSSLKSRLAPFSMDEVTIELSGQVSKTLQVSTKETIGHLYQQLTTSFGGKPFQLMVQCSIPPSPTANIGDVFQIFKNPEGKLRITVLDSELRN